MKRNQSLVFLLLFSLALELAHLLVAQTSKTSDASVEVTRTDLAAAYLRLEKAIQKRPLLDGNVAEVNRAFDRASVAFFSRQYASAIQQLNELVDSLGDAPSLASKIAASVKAVIHPRVVLTREKTNANLLIQSIYPVEISDEKTEINITAQIRSANENVVWKKSLMLAFKPPTANIRFEFSIPVTELALAQGRYDVEVATDDGHLFSLQPLFVSEKSFDEIARANAAQLKKIKAESAEIKQALASCRARNALLQDEPSPSNTTQWLHDPLQLAAELQNEIEQLAQGKNPYKRRTGDYWRVLQVAERTIPLRLYAPAIASEKSLPLVIVLHGAGGDENMFMDGYGAGIIKKLADEHEFIVASPATVLLGQNANHFDALLQMLGDDYALDANRIYVIGHSMGSSIVASLARTRTDKIAAVCCLAGIGFLGNAEKIAPTLLVAGSLDPLVPFEMVRIAAEQAGRRNLPVEFRAMKNRGHTLMVGEALPDVVKWLLNRRLTPSQ